MTDIDFDELDKAVSSLMGDETVPQPKPDKPAADEQKPTETSTTVEQPSAEVTPVASATSLEQSTAEVVAPTAPERPASLAVKRRGQFMDVMHPSADMKTPSARAAKPLTRVSRQGAVVTPTTDTVTPEPPVVTVPESTIPAAETPTLDTPATPAVSETPAWPDPLDLAENDDKPSTPEPEAPVVEDTTPAPETPNEPLVSPFLPDAKVEKRPLGEAQPTGPVDEPTASEDVSELESPLPVELSGGVLAVESNELHTEEKPAPAAAEKATATPSPQLEQPAAPASIPPQYKAGDAKDEPAEHSALYDAVSATAAAPKAKKKSGWLVPVAIIGLIILGCAGGIAVYYMMTK